MQLTRTFTWNNATITVRRSVVRDHIAVEVLASQLYEDSDSRVDSHAKQTYAWFVQRSTVDGDLGFPFATPNSPVGEWEAGYAAFMDMPDDMLFVKWNEELALVNAAANTAALTPAAQKNDSAF